MTPVPVECQNYLASGPDDVHSRAWAEHPPNDNAHGGREIAQAGNDQTWSINDLVATNRRADHAAS
jgi:hypothetical protein